MLTAGSRCDLEPVFFLAPQWGSFEISAESMFMGGFWGSKKLLQNFFSLRFALVGDFMRLRALYELVDGFEVMRQKLAGAGCREKAEGLEIAITEINTLLRTDTENKINRGQARLDRMRERLKEGR